MKMTIWLWGIHSSRNPAGKTLDDNYLNRHPNQVVASSGFSENKGLNEVLSLAGS